MKKRKTKRGFEIIEFIDKYDTKCSLQKSSLALEEAIWLGVDDADFTIFDETMGKYITKKLPKNFSVNTRMHLTQKQVKDLLPHLIKFAETGEL